MTTCKTCQYNVITTAPDKTLINQCFGLPPTPALLHTQQGVTGINLRPTVDIDNKSCSLYQELKIEFLQ